MGRNQIARKRGSPMANTFSFSNFNKERLFTFDCNKIAGNYTNLEQMFNEDGEGKEYQIKGIYISTSSQFDPEAPIVALANTYVNLPQHQLADVKAMLADKNAIAAINAGLAGFTIRQYERSVKVGKKIQQKTCYSAEWCDVLPSDFEEEEEE